MATHKVTLYLSSHSSYMNYKATFVPCMLYHLFVFALFSISINPSLVSWDGELMVYVFCIPSLLVIIFLGYWFIVGNVLNWIALGCTRIFNWKKREENKNCKKNERKIVIFFFCQFIKKNCERLWYLQSDVGGGWMNIVNYDLILWRISVYSDRVLHHCLPLHEEDPWNYIHTGACFLCVEALQPLLASFTCGPRRGSQDHTQQAPHCAAADSSFLLIVAFWS